MQTFLSLLALSIAAGSFVFAGLQTRILAKQNSVLTATSQLSYNLQVMIRLEDILFQIADDPDSHAHAWSQGSALNRRPEVAIEALLDVMAMAKAAVPYLPDFAKYEPDWDSYINFILDNSHGLRAKLLSRSDWWPELDPFMRRIRDEQAENTKNLVGRARSRSGLY